VNKEGQGRIPNTEDFCRQCDEDNVAAGRGRQSRSPSVECCFSTASSSCRIDSVGKWWDDSARGRYRIIQYFSVRIIHGPTGRSCSLLIQLLLLLLACFCQSSEKHVRCRSIAY